MVSQVKRGVLDFIGAARPSIADPFLPRKIEEGRMEEIRECIGCNICYASNTRGTPLRCTQNPTMGEEWRRGWHPERIAAKGSDDAVLVVGGGPAGLEAARALGQRGYRVLLAEASRVLGGRVNGESRLPGLAEWARVRDWRLGRLKTLANVEIYLESRLDARQILDFGIPQVLIATGARWWHRPPSPPRHRRLRS
jgi:dimethylamine/trimethylamine dehydrogenase